MLLLTKFRAATLAVAATVLYGTAQAQWAERYDDPRRYLYNPLNWEPLRRTGGGRCL